MHSVLRQWTVWIIRTASRKITHIVNQCYCKVDEQTINKFIQFYALLLCHIMILTVVLDCIWMQQNYKGVLKEWCDEIVYLERSITLLFTSVNLNVHKKTLQPTCMWDWIFLIVKHWIPKSKWGSSFCHFQRVSIQKFHKGVTQVSISQAQT